jgi:multidrug resistance protein, MATE family
VSKHPYLCEVRPTLALALPIIIGQVSQMLMGVTDSLMIGHVGTVPLAASAFAGNIFGIFFILGIGMMLPVAVLVARAHGAGRPEECAQLLRHGLVLSVFFGVLETVAMFALLPRFQDFGQPAEVIAEARAYYQVIAVSMVPVLVFQVFRQFAESLGRPWIPMGIMLGGVALNAFLNWVMIYGRLGCPAMGLAGAGWATLIARVVVVMVIVVWLAGSSSIRIAWPGKWLGAFSRKRFVGMFKIGAPASSQLLFEGGAFTAASIMMGWLGTVSLAAHQIALSCAATTFMFMLGLSMAVGIRIGQAVGAGEQARLRPIGVTAYAMCLGVMGFFALMFLGAGQWIAGCFVRDAEVAALAAQLLIVAGIFQIFDGGQVIGAGALRGLTDVKVPALITFIAYWVIALPGGCYFGLKAGHGAVAVWVSLACGLAFAAIFLAMRFARLTRHPLRVSTGLNVQAGGS